MEGANSRAHDAFLCRVSFSVLLHGSSSLLRASPTRVQQKFANEQDGTKRMFFVVAGRRAKVLK
jgi:hypothetical protein